MYAYLPHFVMFGSMMIMHMFIMPFLMIDKPSDFYLSVNQVYMGTFMSIVMVMVEGAMHPISVTAWVLLSLALVALIVLIKRQWGVGWRQYLRDMIPHHSMAIQTSYRQLKHPFAREIYDIQLQEIDAMKTMLEEGELPTLGMRNEP